MSRLTDLLADAMALQMGTHPLAEAYRFAKNVDKLSDARDAEKLQTLRTIAESRRCPECHRLLGEKEACSCCRAKPTVGQAQASCVAQPEWTGPADSMLGLRRSSNQWLKDQQARQSRQAEINAEAAIRNGQVIAGETVWNGPSRAEWQGAPDVGSMSKMHQAKRQNDPVVGQAFETHVNELFDDWVARSKAGLCDNKMTPEELSAHLVAGRTAALAGRRLKERDG